jgi:hypothetical protein
MIAFCIGQEKKLGLRQRTWRRMTLLSFYLMAVNIAARNFFVTLNSIAEGESPLLYAMWEMRLTWWLFSGIQERERDLIHSLLP